MIPILFDKAATTFTTYGKGALKDAISCVVTEERNGAFELMMEYPMDGIHFADIEESAIILAKPSENQNPQAFRVYRITEPLNGQVTVYAEHIAYALRYIPVMPFTATGVQAALACLVSEAAITNPFSFVTDLTAQKVYTTAVPRSAKNIIGGDNGLLSAYGGELSYDNYTVNLKAARGADHGVTLRYGKNITEFEKTIDLSNTVTGVLPYYKQNTTLVIGDITQIQSPLAYDKIEAVDVSSMFASGATPTKQQVTNAGATTLASLSNVGTPNVNFTISFINLAQTEEYKDIAPLEQVGLCDTVTIIFEKFGISAKSKVIKTVYDCLLERYNEIEIGESNYSLTTQVVTQAVKIDDAVSSIEKLNDQIVLKVSKGQVSSEISIESGQVTFNSNRLVVNSTNFKLDEDGNVELAGALKAGSTISTANFSVDEHGQVSATGLQIYGNSVLFGSLVNTGTSGGASYRTEITGGKIQTNHIDLGGNDFVSGAGLYLERGGVHCVSIYQSGNNANNFDGSVIVDGAIIYQNSTLQKNSITIPNTSITINYIGW